MHVRRATRLLAPFFCALAVVSCTFKGKAGPPNAATGGSGDLFGGGDLFNAYLADVRRNILAPAVGRLAASPDYPICRFDECPNDGNSLCKALPSLTATQLTFCRDFVRQNIAAIKAAVESDAIRVVGTTQDVLFNGVPVTGGTTLAATGDILVNIGRVRGLGLKRLDIAAVLGHEFMHKIPYPAAGSFLADLQQPGPFSMGDGGFELLTAAGIALAFYARSLGLESAVTELTSPSLGISEGPNYNFGTAAPGTTVTKTFTVTNFGGAEAPSFTVDSAALKAPFFLAGGSCPAVAVLAAGASCTVTLAYSPSAAGQSSGELRIYYSSGDHVTWSQMALAGGADSGTPAPTPSPTPAAPPDFLPTRFVLFRDGNWTFLEFSQSGVTSSTVAYGAPGDLAVMGDWVGDGVRRIGTYAAGTWHLSLDNKAYSPSTTIAFDFGADGDIPVVGKWVAGDKRDFTGSFRPSLGRWWLNTSFKSWNDSAHTDVQFNLGAAGDTPLLGRWSATDQADRPGIWHPTDGTWTLGYPPNTTQLQFGLLGDVPILGRWHATDKFDLTGVWRVGTFALNTVEASYSDTTSIWVQPGFPAVGVPFTGKWKAGDGADYVGVWHPDSGSFYFYMGRDANGMYRVVGFHGYGSPGDKLLRP